MIVYTIQYCRMKLLPVTNNFANRILIDCKCNVTPHGYNRLRLCVSWRTRTCSIAIDTALISAHLRPDVTEIPLTALTRTERKRGIAPFRSRFLLAANN